MFSDPFQIQILIGCFCGNIDSRFSYQNITFRNFRKSGQLLSDSLRKSCSPHDTIRNICSDLYCTFHQLFFSKP